MLAAPKLRAGPLAAVFFYVNLEITTDGAKREPAFQIDLKSLMLLAGRGRDRKAVIGCSVVCEVFITDLPIIPPFSSPEPDF